MLPNKFLHKWVPPCIARYSASSAGGRLDEENPKEKDDETIELTDEELNEIFANDDFDNGEDGSEIRSFYFSSSDPYAKVEPRPDDAPSESFLSMTRATRKRC